MAALMTDNDPETTATATRLKEICASYTDGLNARDFDPESPRWTETLAPNFRLYVTSDALYGQHLPPSSTSVTGSDGSRDLDVVGMCDVLRRGAEENPHWHSRLVDVAVSVYKDERVDGRQWRKERVDAEVWCRCEHSGVPEGVTRSTVWVGYFGNAGGRWALVGARHVSGMGSWDAI